MIDEGTIKRMHTRVIALCARSYWRGYRHGAGAVALGVSVAIVLARVTGWIVVT